MIDYMDVLDFKAYISTEYPTTTLHICSKDGANNEYLIQNSAISVFNFDDIKNNESKESCFPRNVSLTSPDAVFINDSSEIKLIEFKNSYLGDIYKPAVRVKFYESLILLQKRFQFQYIDKITYILVHKGRRRTPKHHRIKEGKCPDELIILKHQFPIDVQVYEAKYFDSNCYKILGTK